MRTRIVLLTLLISFLDDAHAQRQGNGIAAPPGGGAIAMDYEAVRQSRIASALRITEKIVLDGRLDEPVWGRAEVSADFIQWEPTPGAPARDKTEVRFLYDEENLYIGFTNWDAEPDHLVVNELREDFAGQESDGVAVVLDTLHDRRSGFIFGTNPAGARRDMQVANDGAQVNMDWDGVWDVRVSRFEQGWLAEFVIPFKTLRFSSGAAQEWGLNMLRRVRRTNEDSNWSPIPRRYRGTRISTAGTLRGLQGVRQGRNLKVKPYATAGATQARTNEELQTKADYDGGVDLKYSLTPSLTLDLTYRTDFSQVEVDQQQVNLTRFNIFFPEKREFFLENAGTFNFGGGGGAGGGGPGGGQNLIPFFSRRIGLSSSGTPIPILGGSRVSGKLGKYDVGFLAMKTDKLGATPSSNFMVGRVKRNILKNSWIGALVTSRDSNLKDDYNRVYGADLRLQFYDKLDFDGYLLGSETPGKHGKNLARRFESGWRDDDLTISAEYESIDTNFNPEMGFVRRRDNTKYAGDFSWRPRLEGSRTVRNFNVSTNYDYFENNLAKSLETRTHSVGLGVFFQNSSNLNFNTLRTFDRLAAPFAIRSDLSIPGGDYTYRSYSIGFNTDRSRAIGGNGNFNVGDFWNGKKTTFNGGLDLKPSYHLNIDVNYNYNRVKLPNGRFTTKLLGTRVLYAFTSRAFLNAFVQYNADTHQFSSNIRFNITHHPLSDFYIVYNDRRDTISGQLLERAIIVKFTNLFNF